MISKEVNQLQIQMNENTANDNVLREIAELSTKFTSLKMGLKTLSEQVTYISRRSDVDKYATIEREVRIIADQIEDINQQIVDVKRKDQNFQNEIDGFNLSFQQLRSSQRRGGSSGGSSGSCSSGGQCVNNAQMILIKSIPRRAQKVEIVYKVVNRMKENMNELAKKILNINFTTDIKDIYENLENLEDRFEDFRYSTESFHNRTDLINDHDSREDSTKWDKSGRRNDTDYTYDDSSIDSEETSSYINEG